MKQSEKGHSDSVPKTLRADGLETISPVTTNGIEKQHEVLSKSLRKEQDPVKLRGSGRRITFATEDEMTCMFPENGIFGYWRLQSRNSAICRNLKRRERQGSQWSQVGRGMNSKSPDIFRKHFDSTRDACRFFKKLLSVEGGSSKTDTEVPTEESKPPDEASSSQNLAYSTLKKWTALPNQRRKQRRQFERAK